MKIPSLLILTVVAALLFTAERKRVSVPAPVKCSCLCKSCECKPCHCVVGD